jgi:hypothetical protein
VTVNVYLAISGEYDDYQVHHVFTRREDAEAYPLADGVEEREVHDGPVEVRDWHNLSWDPLRPDEEASDLRVANPYQMTERRDFDGRPGHIQHQWWTDPRPYLHVEGWDQKGVLKVYSEQRAQYIELAKETAK